MPPLELDTEEARVAFEEGKRRYEEHKARKKRKVAVPAGIVKRGQGKSEDNGK